jgi:hypothetical protein
MKMVLTRQDLILYQRLRKSASNTHHSTPTKARLRAAHQVLQNHDFRGVQDSNNTLFRQLGIAKSFAYRILASELINQSDYTHYNQPVVIEIC